MGFRIFGKEDQKQGGKERSEKKRWESEEEEKKEIEMRVREKREKSTWKMHLRVKQIEQKIRFFHVSDS